jgi:hypothetical protein
MPVLLHMQMMRGAEMLFAALFAVTFLGRKLNKYHLLGIFCCIVRGRGEASYTSSVAEHVSVMISRQLASMGGASHGTEQLLGRAGEARVAGAVSTR